MRKRKGEQVIKTHLTNIRQDTRHSFSHVKDNLTGKSAPRDKTLYRSKQRKPLKNSNKYLQRTKLPSMNSRMEGNSNSSTMIGSTPPLLAQDVYQVSFQNFTELRSLEKKPNGQNT